MVLLVEAERALYSGDVENLLLVLLIGVESCAVHYQVVTQCLLLNATGDDPSLDKVWSHESALAFVLTNTSLEGFDCCLRVPDEPVAQDREQHSSKPDP